MSGVLRSGVVRAIVRSNCLLNTQNFTPIVAQKCNISGKTLRGSKVAKPKAYDYKEKPYGFIQACLDKTTKRLDENSKIIVVDGPIASGKSKFAKELAGELEMLYLPEVSMDEIYVNPYGYDLRKLDHQLPEKCRSFDIKNFCADPNHSLVAQFQIRMYMLRYSQYIDALAHVLSTGQGVILDRSCYSDFVFLEAMFKHNYISKGARSIYYELRNNTIGELLKPHLVIYLDVPASTTKDRIKARNVDYEAKSKVFTEEYLNDVEAIYKQQYLKDISTHAELLVYDWSNGGETEVVVEDIERINFDRFDKHDSKMRDWLLEKEWDWCEMRMRFANEKHVLMNYFNIPRFDVPELTLEAHDAKAFQEVWTNAPGQKYRFGFNADMGDQGLLTKVKLERRNTL